MITEIQTVYENEMVLPTLTICTKKNNSLNINYCYYSVHLSCKNMYENFNFEWMKCLKINSGKNISNQSVDLVKTFFGGSLYGFNLSIIISNHELYVNIFITEKNVKPKFLNTGSLRAYKNQNTLISINKKVEKKLPKPYSDCTNDFNSTLRNCTEDFDSTLKNCTDDFNSRFYNEIFKSNTTYTKDYCIYLCTLMVFADTYNCTFDDIYRNKYNKSCIDLLDNETYSNATTWSNMKKKCDKLCPQECNTTTYTTTTQQFNDPSIKNDSILINLFFEELSYESVKQSEKINPSEFPLVIFSTIGAFFGISFISVFEILDVMFEVLFVNFQ